MQYVETSRRMKHILYYISISLTILLLFRGDSIAPEIIILTPSANDSLSYDQGKLILVSALKDAGSELTISTQWEIEKAIAVGSMAEKERFPKEFYKLFLPNSTIESIVYRYKYFSGYSKPESLAYSYADSMSIKSFWQQSAFTEMVKKIQREDMQEVLFHIRGWRDTTYMAIYDDPLNDSRTLYKLPIQLIAGKNTIYFANSAGRATAFKYSTTYGTECPTIESRPTHFHNTALEQNCIPCHEGLPSSLEEKSMTADCSTCHKEKFSAKYLHSPVEMKECSSCHLWSAEKKLVVVDEGIPDKCFSCHSDIGDTVTQSAVPHAVASECMTCHSPHGSDQPHQLKQDVYSLCTSCHTDKTINHPVGRHPLRFVTYGEKNEELTCVSCHNPHGSPNEKLARVGGGKMAMCEQCH